MKRMLRVTSIVMIICMLFTVASFASTGNQNEKITYRSISIVVNGSEIAPCDVNGNSTEPFIRNADGSTYLPVRAVAGALGLDVDWNEATNTVILKSDGTVKTGTNKPVKSNKEITATLYYRDIVITLDGKAVELKNAQGNPVEPFIKDGTTYIPVRAVATALGCEVGWDGDTNTVTLTKGSVSPDPQMALAIKEQTESQTVDVGDYGKFEVKAEGGTEPYFYKWEYYDETRWIDCPVLPTVFSPEGSVLKENVGRGPVYDVRCTVTDADGNEVVSKKMICYKSENKLSVDKLVMYVTDVVKFKKGTAHAGVAVKVDIVNGELHVGDNIVIYDVATNTSVNTTVKFIAVQGMEAEVARTGIDAVISLGGLFDYDSEGNPNTGFISKGDAIVGADSGLAPSVSMESVLIGDIHMFKKAELLENNTGITGDEILTINDKSAPDFMYHENPDFLMSGTLKIPYNSITIGENVLNAELKPNSNVLIFKGQTLYIVKNGIKYGTFKVKTVRSH